MTDTASAAPEALPVNHPPIDFPPIQGPINHLPPDITEGEFIKGTAPEVYQVVNTRKRWVPDPPTLEALAPKFWESVVDVPQREVNLIINGVPFPSREDGRIYRGNNTPPVYVIENFQKRHIPNPETLIETFGGWNKVVLIAQTDLDAIPVGPDIPSV